MKNQLKERKYLCECGSEFKEYVWDNDLDKYSFKCPCKRTITKDNLIKEKKVEVQAIRTETKNR